MGTGEGQSHNAQSKPLRIREAKQSRLGGKTRGWFWHVSGVSGLSDVTETTLSGQVDTGTCPVVVLDLKGEVGLQYKPIIRREMLLKTYTR